MDASSKIYIRFSPRAVLMVKFRSGVLDICISKWFRTRKLHYWLLHSSILKSVRRTGLCPFMRSLTIIIFEWPKRFKWWARTVVRHQEETLETRKLLIQRRSRVRRNRSRLNRGGARHRFLFNSLPPSHRGWSCCWGQAIIISTERCGCFNAKTLYPLRNYGRTFFEEPGNGGLNN